MQRTLMAMLSLMLIVIACNNEPEKFNGLDLTMSNLYRSSDAESRSISPENLTGEKGKGGMATEGEGEVKFFIDGDTDFPTICGTGEEDYFCGLLVPA